MKKRILSLVLVVAMLLSVLPAVSAADAVPAFSTYYLTLSDSIAINVKGKNLTDTCFVTFNDGDQVTAKNNVFTYEGMSPALLADPVVVKLYESSEDTEPTEVTVTALGYCEAVLNSTSFGHEVKSLAANLIEFGKAFYGYKEATDDDFTAEQIATDVDYSAYITKPDPKMNEASSGANDAWAGVSLALDETVKIRFDVKAESADGLKLCVDGYDPIIDFVLNTEDYKDLDTLVYSVYFDRLGPAQMHKVIKAQVLQGEAELTNKISYSIEKYAYDVQQTSYPQELKDLTVAMLQYGDAAYRYVAKDAPHIELISDFSYDSCGWTKNTLVVTEDGELMGTGEKVATTGGITANIPLTLPAVGGIYSVEWEQRVVPNKATKMEVGLLIQNENGSMINFGVAVSTKDGVTTGTIRNAYGGTSKAGVDLNQTFKMKAVVDLDNYTYDMYVGGELFGSGLNMNSTHDSEINTDATKVKGINKLAKLAFMVKGADDASAAGYIDNVVVKRIDDAEKVVLTGEAVEITGIKTNDTVTHTRQRGRVSYEWTYQLNSNECDNLDSKVILKSGTNSILNIGAKVKEAGGDYFFYTYDGDATPENLSELVCEENKTYKVKVVADLHAYRYDAFITDDQGVTTQIATGRLLRTYGENQMATALDGYVTAVSKKNSAEEATDASVVKFGDVVVKKTNQGAGLLEEVDFGTADGVYTLKNAQNKSFTLSETYKGTVCLEYRIKVEPAVAGYHGKLFTRNASDKTTANIGVSNGVTNISGTPKSAKAANNEWHTIKIVYSDGKLFSAYVNGVVIQESAGFTNDPGLKYIYIQSESGTGTVSFEDVRVYEVY